MMMRSSRTEPPDLQACVIKSTDDIIGTHVIYLYTDPSRSLCKLSMKFRFESIVKVCEKVTNIVQLIS